MQRSTLEINLGAICHNWRVQKQRVGGSVECAAVLKGNAYGCGIERVSEALWADGCATFFVATLEEGMLIRNLLPEARIAALNGIIGEASLFTDWNVTPVISTMRDALIWIESCHESKIQIAGIFQVETGLNRLGLSFDELKRLVPAIPAAMRPITVLSHLSASADPASPTNLQQLEKFKFLADLFSQAGITVELSLADSAGVCLGADYHFDLVRPGISLFGASNIPVPGQHSMDLMNVIRLEAPVIQVRWLKPGDAVGYGGDKIVRPTRIATAAIGFADGLPRTLAGCGYGMVSDQRIPILGNISMDLTVFDVTDLPEADVVTGTRVMIIGPGRHLDDVAFEAGTIADEMLTRLGSRFELRVILNSEEIT